MNNENTPIGATPSDVTDAMVDAYLTAQRATVEEANRFGRPNIGGLHTNTVREACRAGLSAALRGREEAAPEARERVAIAERNAMTDFELTRSIIYDCPALRMPQSFIEKLGKVAQIVVLKGASKEMAQYIVDACNDKIKNSV